jgi:DNA polymerase elongation subunit (family B)
MSSTVETEKMINKDIEIEKFLQGHNNDTKYLVNIEADYFTNKVSLIFDFPGIGNQVVKDVPYRPFMYIKDLNKIGLSSYYKNDKYKRQNINDYGIRIVKMETNGHDRLEYGYMYKVYGNSIVDINKYFKEGKLKIVDNVLFRKYLENYCGYIFDDSKEGKKYSEKYYKFIKDEYVSPKESDLRLFYKIRPEEQYLIQNGVRLFKGFEKYNEVHRLQFDIETTGLDPETSRIFLLGIKDNRGFEKVLKVKEKDDNLSEREVIVNFFEIINKIKPSIITHYNGENFDWDFIIKRANTVGIDFNLKYTKNINGFQYERNSLITTRDELKVIERLPEQTVKYGGEVEIYTKTKLWGYSNVDIIHAVKRTMAVNSDIQSAGLKYICKFENINKEDRMYVKGDRIFKIWDEKKYYIINKKNNEYKVIHEDFQDKPYEYLDKFKNNLHKGKKYDYPFDLENIDNIDIINGEEIVDRYLLDDLWETEQVDSKYNESSFLLAKLVPTTYERITTMGSAAVWKLIMTAWSYENNLAIPISDPDKSKFSGGLARAYTIGFAENIRKLDFAGLYPSLQITYDIFPTVDVTNVLKRLLTYLLGTRNVFKKLSNDDSLSKEERSFYKTKQLPLKILNNSLFGALGSGIAFNWGETIVSAHITCAGRLHLRKMIDYFVGYNFTPVLAVTDGVNFAIPEYTYKDIEGNVLNEPVLVENIVYNSDGREYRGVSAIVERYNTEILQFSDDEGRLIKVDDDGSFKSSLTLSRINYANLTFDSVDSKTGKIIHGKVKLTGNTIKSKTMSEYIEDFIDKGMRLILDNKPSEFVEYYYSYIEKIFYKQIPLKKIASKSKVRLMPDKYLDRGTDKNGREKGKQAHMELIIKENINVELGNTIYYINIGTSKSHGDTKIIKNKETGEEYMCSVLIDTKLMEEKPDLLGEYNVKKYLAAFNERVKALLTGFHPDIQNTLLKDIVKDKTTKKDVLEEREYYTDSQLKLMGFEKDNIEESMYLEELELEFWNKTGRNPYKIYDNFKIPDYDSLNGVQKYQEMLDKLNKNRDGINKPIIKSIDDKFEEGDLVLKKNNDVFTIHKSEKGYLKEIYKL